MIEVEASPASACLPGFFYRDAVAALSREGLRDRMLSRVSPGRMQLCPQQRGVIDRGLCDWLERRHPQTRFRLHANARLSDRLEMFDASMDIRDAKAGGYARRLKRACGWLKAEAYTYHAGNRSVSLERMRENVLRLEDFLGIPVGVEGLYPSRRSGEAWSLSTLAEHEWLLTAGIGYALDLSHFQIICRAELGVEGEEGGADLAKALLEGERCLEAHVSDNDFRRDAHRGLEEERWWMGVLNGADRPARQAVFCESDQRAFSGAGRKGSGVVDEGTGKEENGASEEAEGDGE